jgi:photosystem II stability/assembly factor-like uncharacterized protein
MKRLFSLLLFFFFIQNSFAQQIQILTDSIHSDFRGLSVVDNHVVWVSGSNGTVGRSIDGGKNWKWMIIKGFEKRDFRDIEAFDKKNAVIMAVDEPAFILRTNDGGQNWKIVFENRTKGMFLDAILFWNDKSGIVIGDPINHLFYIGRTFDGGKTWQNIPDKYKPVADSGEACFAASGTNIGRLKKSEAVFVTGGLSSNIFIRDKKIRLPIIQGKESAGANSIAINNSKTMIIVGGDFLQKDSTDKNCAISTDGGHSWFQPTVPPAGYRSCVVFLKKDHWITCGLNGVDISNDNGKIWKKFSAESFHVCQKAKRGNAVYFAGINGRVAKLLQ